MTPFRRAPIGGGQHQYQSPTNIRDCFNPANGIEWVKWIKDEPNDMCMLLEHSRFRCPNCRNPIPVHEYQSFSTRLTKREPLNCPHCGTTLNWEPLRHAIAHYSLWVAFLTFPLPFLGLYSFEIGMWVLGMCLLASALGMATQNLIIQSGDE